MQAPITYYVIQRHYVICAHPGCESKHSAHTTFHRAVFPKCTHHGLPKRTPHLAKLTWGSTPPTSALPDGLNVQRRYVTVRVNQYMIIYVNNESKIDMQGMPQPQRSNVQSMPYRLYRHPLPTCSRTPLGKALPAWDFCIHPGELEELARAARKQKGIDKATIKHK